ncbi:hypothetical protein DFQ28_008624 [Apophysomyces sp. BC1034]|nr:hypothetical protein DFQ30_008351 [Apophysomyces sp. BC1015]KAG0174814.1 hypothetical protein DFQ29_007356 [Apophysomyces sp. BC1021]KAG0185886.1 hypothetical protein DFQ28_008624 [Apophysomyces sp. BC1034]
MTVRTLMGCMNRKDIISLSAGQPNSETFPFESMTLKLKNGDSITVDPELFKRALSYDLTSGLPPFNHWLRKLQIIEHAPPVDFDLTVGVGSQDLITKALEMLINPGEALLVEDPTYTGVLSFLKTQPCDLVPVATDADGLVPESLEKILAGWSSPNGQPRPRVIYTVPSGGNPTGATVPYDRKKKIYDICHRYDVLILEDDAYYYLQFGSRVKSYLSLDVDGRVLRCDSMSKILSSGLRLGWATGPKELIDRINVHTMTTNLQAAGVPQLMAFELLDRWGHKGFFEHVDGVAAFYKQKRDEFVECLERRMKGRAEWSVPNAGMFVWLRLLGGITDTYDLVMHKAIEKDVVAVPGVAFMPLGNKTPYLRVSYSNVSKEEMDEGLRRLAEVVDEAAAENAKANGAR